MPPPSEHAVRSAAIRLPEVETGPSIGRRWAGVLAVCLGVMIALVKVTSTVSALSAIQTDLHASASQLAWIISAYNLLVVALVLTAGTLGDLIARRRIFVIGAFLFAASSGLAVASHGTGLLIAAEALMGVGGAAVLPTSLSIVGHTFTDPHERTTAIAMASTTALLCRHRNVRVTESTERPDDAVRGAWEGVR